MRRATPADGWTSSTRKPRRRLRRFSFLLMVPILFGALGTPVAPVTQVAGDELAEAKAKRVALDKQIADQKAQVAQINAMQADLGRQISSTKRELASINADLAAVRKSIDSMVVQIEAVKKIYFGLVAHLQLLDNQLANLLELERHKRSELGIRKAELGERIRAAYATDRTTLLETFLAGGSFTDVISEVSYLNDFAEQDRALAEEIVRAQEELAAIHEAVTATRAQTEVTRIETQKQREALDKQLEELKVAQARLKELEKETARALAVQQSAFAQLAKNKKDLARAIATTSAA